MGGPGARGWKGPRSCLWRGCGCVSGVCVFWFLSVCLFVYVFVWFCVSVSLSLCGCGSLSVRCWVCGVGFVFL